MPNPCLEETIAALAQILGIPAKKIIDALWMLETKTAYRIWYTSKKSGGKRQMQQALQPLSGIQGRIARLVYPFSVSQINHWSVGGRSPRTATLPHLNANAFLTFDIKNAFPSTKKQQVKLSLEKLGFKKELACLMADLVCYSPGEDRNEGFIPLGYNSSPTLFNILLRDIDKMLLLFAEKRGYKVTRFADDFALSTTASSIPKSDRKIVIGLVEGLSSGQFKIPPEKTKYLEAKKGVCFEWLGLVIKESRGKRKIEVFDEKLGECLSAILEALEKGDFSEKTFRHIQGQMNYLKSTYGVHALPLKIAEFYEQYKLMRELAKTREEGQLLLPMPPFQN